MKDYRAGIYLRLSREHPEENNSIEAQREITTKYAIKNVQDVSGGGYKDWCVLRMKIPAVTIEVGENSLSHPIGEESLEKIYQRNKNIIKVLSEVRRIYYDK